MPIFFTIILAKISKGKEGQEVVGEEEEGTEEGKCVLVAGLLR